MMPSDDAQAGFGIAPGLDTDGTPQDIVVFFQLFRLFEVTQIAADGSFGRKIMRK